MNDSLLELAFLVDTWKVLGPVMVDGIPVSGVSGNPVLFQSSFAQQESLELLVPLKDRVAHLFGASGGRCCVRHRVLPRQLWRASKPRGRCRDRPSWVGNDRHLGGMVLRRLEPGMETNRRGRPHGRADQGNPW